MNTRDKIAYLGLIAGLVVSLLTIAGKIESAFALIHCHFHPGAMAATLNILILTIFLPYLKPHTIEFRRKAGKGPSPRQAKALLDQYSRVNHSVRKICGHLHAYIMSLIVFYLIILVKDLAPQTMNVLNATFPYIDLLEISANTISGAFVFLAFVDLSWPGADRATLKPIYAVPGIPFVLIFLLGYLLCLLLFPFKLSQITNIAKIICGSYNALAIFMLVVRIRAIEIHHRRSSLEYANNWRRLYQQGIEILMPLFIFMQLLYVTFMMPYLLPYAAGLEFAVFIVCSLGKGFLLLFIMDFVNNRWLHSFLLEEKA